MNLEKYIEKELCETVLNEKETLEKALIKVIYIVSQLYMQEHNLSNLPKNVKERIKKACVKALTRVDEVLRVKLNAPQEMCDRANAIDYGLRHSEKPKTEVKLTSKELKITKRF